MKFKLFAILAPLFVYPLLADNILHPGTPVLDRPTLTVLGVQFPITGDDNFNATVAVRYRVSGTTTWSQGLPLFRVHPENTVLYTVAPQFAGSIFNLKPATSYDIELHAVDADGPVDQTFTLNATTRPVPSDPPNPRIVNVNSVAGLSTALGASQPGDIIQLADGVYNVGTIFYFGNGTAQNPIVIRGTTEDGTILDGGNCTGCNVIEVYGSFVHIERMTLRNANRAIRFFNVTQGNVVRRVHVINTVLGIFGSLDQKDFYIADNTLQGRLTWPTVYGTDNGIHAVDNGIVAPGFGHVVCHNQISGYGDAMTIGQNGARAADFYGNDILWTYDNGVELDSSEGNTRVFRNRFTNTWDTLSVQPILGGPAYLFRNVVVNAVDEQMKFHALNTTPSQEPNGVLAYNNTFVSPKIDLNLCTPNVSHHFRIENNLFVGPAVLNNTLNKAALWCGPIDDGHFDFNGYWPDGQFNFNLPAPGGGYASVNFANFAAMQAGGVLETHGTLLQGLIFASGLIGMQNYTIQVPPQDATLALGSSGIDRGMVLPNINDGFTGSAPDLGALEVGCPNPLYGPRPVGVDETNEPIGCESSGVMPPDFSISSSPISLTLTQGQSGSSTVTVISLNGLNSAVGVAVSGCPANATCSMSPTSVTPPANGLITSQLNVTTGSTTTAGNFTLTITGTGPSTSHSTTVSLTVNITAPASITATAGTPQSTTISTAFATALQATVKDSGGNPISGATVTFTAPSTGANAKFGALGTATAVTNASGQATASTLTANSTAGSYAVTASVAGLATTASFSLTNAVGAPASITATAGTPQSTAGSTAFATALQATVKDSGGNPVSGATVTFTAPSTGASATFGTLATATAVTNASGQATAPVLTANSTVGSYTVTAAVAGVASGASFSLTNTTVGGTVNLALGKTASQSSTLSGFGTTTAAASAIDGNTDGNFFHGSVSHTNLDANAWWQVDLGASATISSVTVWNRTDCCGDRLSDYWIFVSNTPFLATDTPATLQTRAGTFGSHQTAFPNPSTAIAVNAAGRYVRVQLSGSNYLSLGEVQVFGTTSGVPTFAISGQVTLSGVGQNGVTMTLSGSQSGSIASSGSGNYNFTGLASGGTYTVTPSLSGYTFTPPSQTLSNLSSNQTVNFTATAVTNSSNLALGKAATQSSTLTGFGPAGASNSVDGNTDGNFFHNSVSHTNLDANAWWQVDLGTSATIGSVTIWNRTDCCSDRISDYWVFVSNTPFLATDTPATLQSRAGTFSSHQTTFPNPSASIVVNAAGRYVRVQLSGTNYLSIAEVQVFGSGTGGTTYGISGQVTLSGVGQNGVTMTLSGSQSSTIVTSGAGNYSFTGLASGGTYTVTPSLSGYTFTPPSQTFTNLSGNQTASFTATGNLASGKTATQSSTLSGFGPAGAPNAVDGNTDGNFFHNSVSHTNLDANPWWQVDLGASATVTSVTVWNRTDCCGNRLSDYWVFVSNTPFLATDTPTTLQARAGTFSSHQTTFPNPSTTISVNAPGRYVRVQISGSNYLSLAEVQVFGQ